MVKVLYDKVKKKYIELPKNSPDGFYLDGYLQANLDNLKKDVKKDYDAFILTVGREGYGKSTLSFQAALYCDPTFCLDRVVFTAEQFIEAVQTAKQYEAIVFDGLRYEKIHVRYMKDYDTKKDNKEIIQKKKITTETIKSQKNVSEIVQKNNVQKNILKKGQKYT